MFEEFPTDFCAAGVVAVSAAACAAFIGAKSDLNAGAAVFVNDAAVALIFGFARTTVHFRPLFKVIFCAKECNRFSGNHRRITACVRDDAVLRTAEIENGNGARWFAFAGIDDFFC